MKFALYLPQGELSMKQLIELAQAAEREGFDSVWCPEYFRYSYVLLTAVLQATSRVRVGPACAMAFGCSPFFHARGGRDLAELSGERFVLGLGTGVPMVIGRPLSENPPPVAGMREYIEILRKFWSTWDEHPEERVQYQGNHYTIDASPDVAGYPDIKPRVPVYLAAIGPRMTRLAGEVADGVLASLMSSPRYLREEWLPNLALGAERAARDPSSIERVGLTICSVGSDRERARSMARRQLAFYAPGSSEALAASGASRAWFEADGFGAETEAIYKGWQTGDVHIAMEGVSDPMLDTYTVAGTLEDCRERLETFAESYDVMICYPPSYDTPDESIAAARELIASFSKLQL